MLTMKLVLAIMLAFTAPESVKEYQDMRNACPQHAHYIDYYGQYEYSWKEGSSWLRWTLRFDEVEENDSL